MPVAIDYLFTKFSPQAWGCTGDTGDPGTPGEVFPTGVGVYRFWKAKMLSMRMFSPQAWGCTADQQAIQEDYAVFPTGVGVYRSRRI